MENFNFADISSLIISVNRCRYWTYQSEMYWLQGNLCQKYKGWHSQIYKLCCR